MIFKVVVTIITSICFMFYFLIGTHCISVTFNNFVLDCVVVLMNACVGGVFGDWKIRFWEDE